MDMTMSPVILQLIRSRVIVDECVCKVCIFLVSCLLYVYVCFCCFSFQRQHMYLEIKELLEDADGVLRASDGVSDSAGVGVDLVVVAALKSLVAEEVDGLVGDAIGLLGLVLEVLEAVGLVPASGEDVEGDLASNGEAERAQSMLATGGDLS